MTSEDVPYHDCHQDTYCPKCGAGFPTLQKLNVYDNTFYYDDTDYGIELYNQQQDDEDNYIGEFYRFHCNDCGYSSLIYDNTIDLQEAWIAEHEKNKPNHLYKKYVNAVINSLCEQVTYFYPNAFIELGAQVAEGASMDWDLYIDLVEKLTEDLIVYEDIINQQLMFKKISYEVSCTIDEDTPMYQAIAKEICRRVYKEAEEAFEEYQENEE